MSNTQIKRYLPGTVLLALALPLLTLGADSARVSPYQFPSPPKDLAPGLGHWQVKLDYQGITKAAPFIIANLDQDPYPEFLIKENRNAHPPHASVRAGWRHSKHPAMLHAFDHDGRKLWSFDQGAGIEIGASYGPVLAFDMDGDGISEIYCKTAADPAGQRGVGAITKKDGHEWISRIDPQTGREIARQPWPPRTSQNYNQNERQGLIVAYLDGIRPSVVAIRGYMVDKARIHAFATDLSPIWKWCSRDEEKPERYEGLSHQFCSADVDGDGRDEIVIGGMVVDETGHGLWSADLDHVDTLYVGDFLPERNGLELFAGGETKAFTGMLDARTGATIWSHNFRTQAQNAVGNVAPNRPGMEIVLDKDIGKGHGDPPRTCRSIFGSDGVELDKTALGYTDKHFEHHNMPGQVAFWHPGKSGVFRRNHPIISTHITLCELVADYFGDGREEIISYKSGTIHIFINTAPTATPPPDLKRDRKYRCDLARGTRGFSAYHYLRPLPAYDPTRNTP